MQYIIYQPFMACWFILLKQTHATFVYQQWQNVLQLLTLFFQVLICSCRKQTVSKCYVREVRTKLKRSVGEQGIHNVFWYFPKGIFQKATSQVTISQVVTSQSQVYNFPSGNFTKVRLVAGCKGGERFS